MNGAPESTNAYINKFFFVSSKLLSLEAVVLTTCVELTSSIKESNLLVKYVSIWDILGWEEQHLQLKNLVDFHQQNQQYLHKGIHELQLWINIHNLELLSNKGEN